MGKKKKTYKQTGKSNRKRDKQYKAKKPGPRKSKKTGKKYWERRRNRSDKDRRKRL